MNMTIEVEKGIKRCWFCSEDTADYFTCELCGKSVCPAHSIFIHGFEVRGKSAEGISVCKDHWGDALPAKLIEVLEEENKCIIAPRPPRPPKPPTAADTKEPEIRYL